MPAQKLYIRGGVWWCRVRDRKGRIVRRSTRCKDYQAALIECANFERAAVDTTYALAEETTLSKAIGDYLEDMTVERSASEASLKIAAQKCGHMLDLWGEDMPLGRINADLVKEYIRTRLDEGVSRLTVKKELAHMRQVLLLARHRGRFHVDLERVFPPVFKASPRPKKRCPSQTEVEAVMCHLTRFRSAHIAYFVATGARLGEAGRAERADTDWQRGLVYLRGTKTAKSAAWIPITPVSAPWLAYALEWAPGKRLLFAPWGKLHRDLEAACARAGVPKFTPNDLRRAFTTWHLAAGVAKDVLHHMTRHTTDKLIQTTYGQLTPEALRGLVLEAIGDVPDVYRSPAESGENRMLPPHEDSGKQAPPRRFERPTNGLGIRPQNPHIVGTKRGLARTRVAQSVPSADVDISREFRARAHAWFARNAGGGRS